jgi:hypothetical protein
LKGLFYVRAKPDRFFVPVLIYFYLGEAKSQDGILKRAQPICRKNGKPLRIVTPLFFEERGQGWRSSITEIAEIQNPDYPILTPSILYQLPFFIL